MQWRKEREEKSTTVLPVEIFDQVDMFEEAAKGSGRMQDRWREPPPDEIGAWRGFRNSAGEGACLVFMRQVE
jgi:hypothetical protein